MRRLWKIGLLRSPCIAATSVRKFPMASRMFRFCTGSWCLIPRPAPMPEQWQGMTCDTDIFGDEIGLHRAYVWEPSPLVLTHQYITFETFWIRSTLIYIFYVPCQFVRQFLAVLRLSNPLFEAFRVAGGSTSVLGHQIRRAVYRGEDGQPCLLTRIRPTVGSHKASQFG